MSFVRLSIAALAATAALTACERDHRGPRDPDLAAPALAAALPVAELRAQAVSDPTTACDRVAAHAAAVLQGYFTALTAGLPEADRAAWRDDVAGRFAPWSLAERCTGRATHTAFVDALACVAAATTTTQIMRCDLWQPGAA